MPGHSTSNGVKTSRKAVRGPGYPSLSLEEAVTRLNQLRDANLARTTTNSLSVCTVWGLSSKSGTARAVLASLNHYDLMEYESRGKGKNVRLTELARRIIFDKVPNSKERTAALQQAALAPTYHQKLWEKYHADLPPDHVIETYLILECKFSDTGAQALVRQYRSTLEFAGLFHASGVPTPDRDAMETDINKPEIRIGDLIQVEINGALALKQPDRVRAVQDHEGRRWIFVESSKTGIPIEQVVLIEKANSTAKSLTERPNLSLVPKEISETAFTTIGIRQETIALDEGNVVMTFPESLSMESYMDLEEHLNLFLRKAKRRAALEKRTP